MTTFTLQLNMVVTSLVSAFSCFMQQLVTVLKSDWLKSVINSVILGSLIIIVLSMYLCITLYVFPNCKSLWIKASAK